MITPQVMGRAVRQHHRGRWKIAGLKAWGSFLTMGLLLSSCAPSSDLSEGERETVANAVSVRFDALADAIRRLDVDAIIGFYADRPDLLRIVDGRILRGYDDVIADFRTGFAPVSRIDELVVVDRNVRVLDARSVVSTVRARERFTLVTGQTVGVWAVWTSIWQRFDDTWRIVGPSAHSLSCEQAGPPRKAIRIHPRGCRSIDAFA